MGYEQREMYYLDETLFTGFAACFFCFLFYSGINALDVLFSKVFISFYPLRLIYLS